MFTTENTENTENRKEGGFRISDPNFFFFSGLCVLCALCGKILPSLAER